MSDAHKEANDNGRYEMPKPANDDAERQHEFADNVDFKNLQAAADQIDKIKDHKDFEKQIIKFADHFAEVLIDQRGKIHDAYKSILIHWNGMKGWKQGIVMRGEANLPMIPPLMNTMVEAGLLNYKNDVSDQAREERIKDKLTWEHRKQDVGMFIAKFLAPEVGAFAPLIKILQKFQGHKAEVMTIIRNRLTTLKIQEVVMGKEHRLMEEVEGNFAHGKPVNDTEADEQDEKPRKAA